MNEEFVSYEIAKKLKEKGFEWCRVTTYNSKTKVRNNHIEPTISQVLRWLREEKNIHVEIDIMEAYPEAKLTYWGYNIVLIDKYEVYHFEWNSNSYEQAALAGIEYVIDNLI